LLLAAGGPRGGSPALGPAMAANGGLPQQGAAPAPSTSTRRCLWGGHHFLKLAGLFVERACRGAALEDATEAEGCRQSTDLGGEVPLGREDFAAAAFGADAAGLAEPRAGLLDTSTAEGPSQQLDLSRDFHLSRKDFAASFGMAGAGLALPLADSSAEAAVEAVPSSSSSDAAVPRGKWGIWTDKAEPDMAVSGERRNVVARLFVAGEGACGRFRSREEATAFQAKLLAGRLGWPRQPLESEPRRSPTWDHPVELEARKDYVFRETLPAHGGAGGAVLSREQLESFDERGFLLGLPVLTPEELDVARCEFDELLGTRIDKAPSEDARFRSAHTLSRPLHQDLVARLAKHERVLAIVEDILGSRFVCWSAHLFCKLPGDPTEQPWHQDAGFWPLSESRALTLWLAFDDVDASNSAVTFIEGSHRLGRIPWQPTDAEHHLLTQEIPDAELLGPHTTAELRAGEASLHSDLTVHGSRGNASTRRRAGLALRFVGADAECLGPMINGYRMNGGCILPRGPRSDPRGHWRPLRRRPGGARVPRRVKAEAEG